MIREPIVVVGGHVDHGKTTLLDYIRGSTVADKESGRITQHIGATDVPIDTINRLCGPLLKKYNFNLTIPGLLFIDTPGHEAFSALRERGCNVADIAVLVIDIMQGCQPQTFEVIEFLKRNKTPFVVALTKIDSMKGYNSNLSLQDVMQEIDEGRTLYAQDFTEKFYRIIGQLGEKGFNSDRYDKVKDFTKEILLIPVSARSGKGISELLLFLAGLSQRYLETKLALDESGAGRGTVLEVKEEKGFGKTIDMILCNGSISKDDYVRIDSRNGVTVSKIKMLLKPKPLQEMRLTKEKFEHIEQVYAASGLKIVAENVSEITAGDSISVITQEEAKNLESTIKSIRKKGLKGVIAKVDTEGSADALMELAKKNDVTVYKVEVGTATKEDVLEAKLFKEESFKYGAIFVFNKKVTQDVIDYAESQEIKIFSSDVIYKIFEEYGKWIKQEEENIKKRELEGIIYPFEFKIIPAYVFRQSKPIICGVEVLEGLLKPNVRLIQNNKFVGVLKKIQDKGKDLKEATKGQEVAVSIDGNSIDKLDLEKPIYGFIPLGQRRFVKKYLMNDYQELIEKLDNIYNAISEQHEQEKNS